MSVGPSPAEEIVLALIVQLLRRGLIEPSDIKAMDGLSEEAARLANCAVVEASAPSQAEWLAEQARSRFRIVAGEPRLPDGGKQGG